MMHLRRCRVAMNRLFMYLRQNSHIHRRPSGTKLYSSGNGAWNQVSMSYAPKRIMRTGCATLVSSVAVLAGLAKRASLATDAARCGRRARPPACVLTAPPSCSSAACLLLWKRARSLALGSFWCVSASSPLKRPANGSSSSTASASSSSSSESDSMSLMRLRASSFGRRRRTTVGFGEASGVARGDGRALLALSGFCISPARHVGQYHIPRGGLLSAGRKQYKCQPRSQRSQNMICSSSPLSRHTSHVLHSMQYQLYPCTVSVFFPPTSQCMHDGWPASATLRTTAAALGAHDERLGLLGDPVLLLCAKAKRTELHTSMHLINTLRLDYTMPPAPRGRLLRGVPRRVWRSAHAA